MQTTHKESMASTSKNGVLGSITGMFHSKDPASQKESSLKRADASVAPQSTPNESSSDDEIEEDEDMTADIHTNDKDIDHAKSSKKSVATPKSSAKVPNVVKDKVTGLVKKKLPDFDLPPNPVTSKKTTGRIGCIGGIKRHHGLQARSLDFKTANFKRQVELNFKRSGMKYLRDCAQIHQVTRDCFIPICATSQVLLDRIMKSAAIIAEGSNRRTIRTSDIREAWRQISKPHVDVIQIEHIEESSNIQYADC